MTGSFASAFTALFGLLPLVAQWIGLLAMRHQRNASWWTMTVGTGLQTLGMIVWLIFFVLMFSNLHGSSHVWLEDMALMAGASLTAGVGTLIFAGGFVVHGLSRRAAREREQQLETMTAAMAEELRVLRERVVL